MMTQTSTTFLCPQNGTVTIKFETDAEDKYFDEYVGLGKEEFSHEDIVTRSSLRTGIYSLTLKPSIGIPNLQVDQLINFKFKILENGKERWVFDIPIKITPPIPPPPPRPPGPPRGPNKPFTRVKKPDPNSNQDSGLIDLPRFIPLSKEKHPQKWEKCFGSNEKRGAFVEISSDNKVKISVNTSHPSLVYYKNKHPDITEKKLINKYLNYIGWKTYSIFLIHEAKMITYEDKISVKNMMEMVSDAIAFFGLSYDNAAR